ncbi:hypothetical protein EFK50_12390 [Nocardioides marmoriginsengisoli]|uniref:Uncharacterized protein n=1 Tax=Nocardioides marmoriginsengisoli TaxID=661483 RepID=A0A3N0CGH1_9ACTN|nr:hypothetical protein [Nocardioides marmoriginsengisoli]RNL62560.1 hypothetical protein EFK50_12390 [Nocardioides marmoriginsengisoli]
MGKAIKLPKTKCCVSKSRCDRCPLRMLKEGDLPTGYGVHRRALVRVDSEGRPLTKKTAKKVRPKVKVTKKITKSELAAAVKIQKKKSGKKKSLAA